MDIGDPANYVLPDVNCDFTKVTMTQTDDKNVKIQGAIGKPPTETFKVSATYMDGFKATTVSIINGGQAGAKAHAVANIVKDMIQTTFGSQRNKALKENYFLTK